MVVRAIREVRGVGEVWGVGIVSSIKLLYSYTYKSSRGGE